ncbi:hypothetical protein [Amycolatopsis sp. cmx-8-4]|uniref:hypothetical protein n=1 Tax=Amycolatopsis sp. cmx-8-4 TaxID=2790947 RepID=UPI00397AC973
MVKAIASAWPEPRKKPPPRPSKLDPFKPVIDEFLRTDLDAPRKQRHTVKRIFARLIDEHGMCLRRDRLQRILRRLDQDVR